jgi:hypothetical protein
MTGQGEDILAYLDAAITASENAARSAAEAVGGAGWDGWDREVAVELPGGDTIADGVMYGDLYEPMKKEACEHIALHDPESVLRRCAADRKMLSLMTSETNETGGRPLAVRLIRLLAESYGWTTQTSAPDPAQGPPTDGDQVT